MKRTNRVSTVFLIFALFAALWFPVRPALAAPVVLNNVPEYSWYHGCSPTSAGMLMGYWYGKGYQNLLPGVTDPMVQDANVNKAISSPEHNAADTWGGHAPNSIADFMKTEGGGTSIDNIPTGLADWAAYVGVGTKTAYHDLVGYFSGTFDYADFMAEIDADRPMLLNLLTYSPAYSDWVGHTVVAYGYQDNMFSLTVPTGRTASIEIIVPGFAVMDTWKNGVGAGKHADWKDWSSNPTYAVDDGGVEWWPFLDVTLTDGWFWDDQWDWQVYDGVFYEPAPVPIPGAILLLGPGFAAVLVLRRRIRSAGRP